ncbi:DNA-binding transcriptional LysR family regulator [Neorhizobium sp. 2083]|uniref:LysR family transcriptional regulator n=1 Tax=Neorhizobium sp. 2083 TaxID=2817762 RepID=UPI00285DE058|nr:LysR family transcriptional regulator [Neorhizobium sp. 2083]MDR6820994.1 DNA-binding transcriptional LysR family regulator [Neorhizobium sp. 2083]
MLHVSLRQLEYVVAVGKAGSLSAASKLLSVSQPAISVAITHVEGRLEEPLFIRRKGVPIFPTAFGRVFLKDAETLLNDAERLEKPGVLSQRRQRRITLGILEELAPVWFAPVLVRLTKEYPDIEFRALELSFDTLTRAILSGQIDLGLTYDLGLDGSFDRDVLFRVAPRIWTAPDTQIATRSDITLAEIADLPLILSDQGLSIRHILGLFHAIGFNPVVKHRAASIELLRSLSANGEGYGISYTNPPGSMTYDGLQVARVRISDAHAIEPIVLVSTGSQPEPIGQVRASVADFVARRIPVSEA